MPDEFNLPEIEREVQEYWQERNILQRLRENRQSGEKYYFCQGPPFTSGEAHIGHAWNHVIKDMHIRYKSMRGFNVFRRAGWDMHGLPIEVKVEQEVLKSRTKRDIEKYGIANFIAECKKYAIKNMNAMTEQLKKLGAWLDWDYPYMTLDKYYMASVWFLIKRANDKGLLYSANKVIHWCPRCETAMAGYEVRDEYRVVDDPSVYVKVKAKGRNEYFLVWTTTPWTLPANVAIAAHPDFDYAKVECEGDVLILAKSRLMCLKKDYRILEEFKGNALCGREYESILDIDLQKKIGKYHKIVASDIVVENEGVGLVHIAPGHGEEDALIGGKYGLPNPSPVDESGKLTEKPYEGIYVRDANRIIIDDLKNRDVLFREEKETHSYPHCWRCKTPLIMRTTRQWFLAVSNIKDSLVEKNREIEWIPEMIGSGRFENWLKNAKDWCISRQRYWNTPLPVWTCACGGIEVIGSIKELKEKAVGGLDEETLDLHKPFIDSVRIKCPKCKKEMKRVPDVMDVWLDSGCASWANLCYPHETDKFEKWFPADFITEGSDQTRGWFYSLLACSTIALDRIPYKRVLYHGFTLDAEGKKMSKSLGNVIRPEDMIDKYGADTFRFYVLWSSVPWEDLRFSEEGIQSVSKIFGILWNIRTFAKTYMEIDGFDVNKAKKIELQTEDKWILSRFNRLASEITDSMECVDTFNATKKIQNFIIEMSRWYIKMVRDRVWIEKDDPKKISVYYTLHTVLAGLFKIMAPITPHISEHLYREFAKCESVHLESWIEIDEKMIDDEIEKRMEVSKQVVEAVASLRQKAKIKLRWPIRRVIIESKKGKIGLIDNVVLKMSNAKKIEFLHIESKTTAKPLFDSIGPKFKKDAGKVAKLLLKTDTEKIRRGIDEKGSYAIEGFEITKDDVRFEIHVPEGVIGENFDEGIVYIDTEIDPSLYSEAIAREVIRRIQHMRKEIDMNETEVAGVRIECSDEITKYLSENKELIGKETRTTLDFGGGMGFRKEWIIEDEKIAITIIGKG